MQHFSEYRVSPKIRPNPKIRPSPNFKNDFNISPTLKIRPRRLGEIFLSSSVFLLFEKLLRLFEIKNSATGS